MVQREMSFILNMAFLWMLFTSSLIYLDMEQNGFNEPPRKIIIKSVWCFLALLLVALSMAGF